MNFRITDYLIYNYSLPIINESLNYNLLLTTLIVTEIGNIILLTVFLYLLWNWNFLYLTVTAMTGDDTLFDDNECMELEDKESDNEKMEMEVEMETDDEMEVETDNKELEEMEQEQEQKDDIMEIEIQVEIQEEEQRQDNNDMIETQLSLMSNIENCITTLEQVYNNLQKITTIEPKMLMDIDDFEMIE